MPRKARVRAHSWRANSGFAAVTLAVATVFAATMPIGSASASASIADINSAGPLTDISISSDLNCGVNHTGDSDGEWFANTACGTFLAVGGTLFGPANVPAGGAASPRTTWTETSQSAVTGSGTSGSPYTVTTVVGAGTTGVSLSQTDSYVVGQESYTTQITVKNNGNSSRSVILYRGGDCFLQDSDFGFGIYDSGSGAITCTTSLDPGSRIEQMLPLTAGSNYVEDFFATMWSDIGSQTALPNTCQCNSDIDNALALSWSFDVAAGASKSYSSLVTFSPLGRQPLTITKTADSSSASAGGQDGYTITVNNPNASAVTLDSLVDTLPAGFSYRSGTTSGATTADPSVSGQTLTWGSIPVPAGADASIHFGVNVSTTPGVYSNSVAGSASGYTVAGTGPTAPVTVTGVTQQSLTLAKTADASTATAGGADGYTITLTNPNASSVTVNTVTDALPAGFTYTSGSTTGATTTNPAVSGQNLTWGPLNVAASSNVTLHFGVTVSSTPGTYTNSVTGAAAGGYPVTGTGPTAPVQVKAVATGHSTTGEGSLRPASGGNLTTFSFSISKNGTTVTGNATVSSPKGVFVSTAATTLTVSGHTATAKLNGTWNGQTGYVITIKATDGTPDAVSFTVKKGSTKAFGISNSLTSGAITVS